MDRTRFALPLAFLAFSACKQTGGLDDGTNVDPVTGDRDAAVAVDTGSPPEVPPFDWTDLFPQPRDAGRQPVRDAGQPKPAVKQRVGPQGGQFIVEDAIGLDVPRGALTRTIEISIGELPSPPAGFEGRAWLLEPADTRFAVPSSVALWIPADLLKQAPASEWAVATLQNGAWVALPVQLNDPDGALVLAQTQTLGAFALIRVPPREPKDASVSDASGLDGGTHDAAVPADASVLEDAASPHDAALDATVQEDAEIDAGPVDVDECALGTGVCVIVGTVCVNDPGTYHCACIAPNVLLPNGTCGAP